ncbi:hypothetical protein PoB_003518600 [Plakobranchus ocellatus]|uniref:Uncharacterized protein n=1 Tax=Plakobranchus ocellatus TaxID=259542 RepID=A0AAV4AC10_9GAST|nr:hypothetical protein PoB_003518600 [Plakobranchus ocellatus]
MCFNSRLHFLFDAADRLHLNLKLQLGHFHSAPPSDSGETVLCVNSLSDLLLESSNGGSSSQHAPARDSLRGIDKDRRKYQTQKARK